ncbi:34129_t:CDS:2 [Gigaspora margarita]|uniref:34129_t:CDS:1 n=1 Tax=Gigaspora margarita TaxID=4874 RepID=A0ABN7WQL5_GIGMA|nr:34129_t:CDS:2 [Gigaspora margarita]
MKIFYLDQLLSSNEKQALFGNNSKVVKKKFQIEDISDLTVHLPLVKLS